MSAQELTYPAELLLRQAWRSSLNPQVRMKINTLLASSGKAVEVEDVSVESRELLRARQAVRELLVTYGRRLEGDWYERTAFEVGLDVDDLGFLKDPDSIAKHRGQFEMKGIHAP